MRIKLRYLSFLLGLLLSACSGESKLWRQSDFPLGENFAYAAKFFDPVTQTVCSAVLLSPTTALTAAHCVKREGNFLVLSAAGSSGAHEVARLGEGGDGDTSDLSLLTLDDPLAAKEYPVIGSELKEGETLTFLGFGCESLATRTATGVMQVGENTIIELSQYAYVLTPVASLRSIVGISGGSGLCFGDSGGPALRTVGVAKELVALGHAVRDSREGQYSIFVNLTEAAQRDFLLQKNDELQLGIVFSD